MNLFYGQIVDVFAEDGVPNAKIRVGCALRRISLALLAEAAPGDTVLVCDSMAIGKVDDDRKETYVSGDTR